MGYDADHIGEHAKLRDTTGWRYELIPAGAKIYWYATVRETNSHRRTGSCKISDEISSSIWLQLMTGLLFRLSSTWLKKCKSLRLIPPDYDAFS